MTDLSTSGGPLLGRKALVLGPRGDLHAAVEAALDAAGASVAPAAGPVDVRTASDVREAVHAAVSELGSIDLAVVVPAELVVLDPVSSAGDEAAVSGLIVAMTAAEVLLPELIRAAEEGRPNDLVLLHPDLARRPAPGHAAVGVVAAGIGHLARSLRAEFAGRGARIRAIELPVLHGDDGADRAAWAGPARKWHAALDARDVAGTVVFAAALPPEVNLSEVVIEPTSHRRGSARVGQDMAPTPPAAG